MFILSGNIVKAILVLGIPAALTQFISAAYNLIDAFFAANIGGLQLAVIAFVSPLYNFAAAIGMGLAIGGTSFISREIGRADYNEAKNISLQLVFLSMLCGIFLALLFSIFSNKILMFASATKTLIDDSGSYFVILSFSFPFLFFNHSYFAIKNAKGDTASVLKINLFSMIVKIVLNYLMIIKLHFGISSLAIATILGNAVVSIYAIYDLFCKRRVLQLSFQYFKLNLKQIKSLLLTAIPVIIERTSISFSFIVVNGFVLLFGEIVLAAYGITNRVNSLFFASIAGFGAGLAPMVSQNLAAKNVKRAKKAVNLALIISLTSSVLISALFLPFKETAAGFFVKDNPQLFMYTVQAMGTYSVSLIPWALFQITNGMFIGTGNTKYNMLISSARIYVFRLPLLILFIKYTNLMEYSIWYAMLISNILTGLFALAACFIKSRNLKFAI
ncbi:MAG: MATE family efflux transporter [Spirochaetes bacterium]|nr:MATE family efflux transporter [Spirochaetota bacterium]